MSRLNPTPKLFVTQHWVAFLIISASTLGDELCFVHHPWYDLTVTPERTRGTPTLMNVECYITPKIAWIQEMLYFADDLKLK